MVEPWVSDLDLALPIDGSEIPGFKAWICWNALKSKIHDGFDFACYFKDNNEIILGLPQVKVSSIFNGVVKFIYLLQNPYSTTVILEHPIAGRKLYSLYCHVVPLVSKGQKISKGQTIAVLYRDHGENAGRLVHLHFMLGKRCVNFILYEAWGEFIGKKLAGLENPTKFFPGLNSYVCNPQGALEFIVPELGPNLRKPIIANFKKLLYSPPPGKKLITYEKQVLEKPMT